MNAEKIKERKLFYVENLKGAKRIDEMFFSHRKILNELNNCFPQEGDFSYDDQCKLIHHIEFEWLKGIARLDNGSEETCLALSNWTDAWDTLCQIEKCFCNGDIKKDLSKEQVELIEKSVIPALALKVARERLEKGLRNVIFNGKDIASRNFIHSMMGKGIKLEDVEVGIGQVAWLYDAKMPLLFKVKKVFF